MNVYRFPENRITKVGFCLYLFVMLYFCRNSMFTLSLFGFYPSLAITLAATALLGLAFLWNQRRDLKRVFTDGRMAIFALAAAVILVPMVLKRDWQFMYLSILIHILTAWFLTYFISWREAAKYYVGILTVLGIYSLFATYLFRIPIDMGMVEKDVFRNGSGIGIYNFLFAVVARSYEKTRNFGIFREPGVYQYYILLALLLTQYGIQWKKQWKMWVITAVLSVVMLSTQATGGVAELGLLAIFVFFDKKLYKIKWLRNLVIVMLVLAPGFIYYNYDYYTPLWQKFELMFIGKLFTRPDDSLFERTASITVNLNFLLEHPLVGAKISDVMHSVVNNTSSTMILFAIFGAISGLFHVAAWAALVWNKARSPIGNLCLMVILFLSFNTQNYTGDFFFWLFPVMALTETLVPMVRKGNV